MADGDLEARLAACEAELGRLRDREAIRDVLIRYSRALDWLDEELLQDVFFDDATIDYGFFTGSGKEFRPLVMEIERGFGRRAHFSGQVAIDLHGATAFVASYSLAIGSPTASPPSELNSFYGYYHDRFERRGQSWNIAERRYLLIAGTSLGEMEIGGGLAALNMIGETHPGHPDYRRIA